MAWYVPLVYFLSLTSTKCQNFCFWSTFLSLHLISKAGFLVQNLSVSLLPFGICFSFLYHTIIQSFSLVETHLLQQKFGLSLSMCRAIGSRDPQKLSLSRQDQQIYPLLCYCKGRLSLFFFMNTNCSKDKILLLSSSLLGRLCRHDFLLQNSMDLISFWKKELMHGNLDIRKKGSCLCVWYCDIICILIKNK